MNLQASLSFFEHIPVDWIILGVVLIVIFLATLRSGSNRACALVITLPIAVFTFGALAQTALLGSLIASASSAYAQPVILLALVIAYFLLVSRILGYSGDSGSSIPGALIVALAATAVVVVFWLSVPSLETIWRFGPSIHTLFGASYRFYWLAGAYAALAGARS